VNERIQTPQKYIESGGSPKKSRNQSYIQMQRKVASKP